MENVENKIQWWKCMIFCEKDANLKIRPTAKQEENRNVNLPEMHSTGKQEENGKCGK